jgi:hypothetical protein
MVSLARMPRATLLEAMTLIDLWAILSVLCVIPMDLVDFFGEKGLRDSICSEFRFTLSRQLSSCVIAFHGGSSRPGKVSLPLCRLVGLLQTVGIVSGLGECVDRLNIMSQPFRTVLCRLGLCIAAPKYCTPRYPYFLSFFSFFFFFSPLGGDGTCFSPDYLGPPITAVLQLQLTWRLQVVKISQRMAALV